tara:strand:+ start:2433 stop:2759 length:327 start_codon:yes stop_codon:yes gene_type:complete
MSSEKMSNHNQDKNKIYIENADIFTNGTPEKYKSVDVNVVGEIRNGKNEIISYINPLIMVLNQHSRQCQEKIDALISAGADPDSKLEYYGKQLSFRDIAEKYFNDIKI